MSEAFYPLDIDPTVEDQLEQLVEDTMSNPVPSTKFGDEVIIEAPRVTVLPGETVAEAHLRLQRENAEK